MSVPSYQREESKTDYMLKLNQLNKILMEILFSGPAKYRNTLGDKMLELNIESLQLAYQANGVKISSQTVGNITVDQYNLRRQALNKILSNTLCISTLFDQYLDSIILIDRQYNDENKVKNKFIKNISKTDPTIYNRELTDEERLNLNFAIKNAQKRKSDRFKKTNKKRQVIGQLIDEIIANIIAVKQKDNNFKSKIKKNKNEQLLEELLTILKEKLI